MIYSMSNGDWHYCFDCKSSGGMAELAAAVWGISRREALYRLVHEGASIPPDSLTDERVSAYVNQRLRKRDRVRLWWQRCQQSLVYRPDRAMATLRRRLGLLGDLSRERTLAGPAQFLGVSEKVDARVALNGNPWHGSHNEPFAGHGWGKLLVTPYFDAPGSIVGLHFIGRNGTKADRLFRSIDPGQPVSEREAGLAGLGAVLESDPTAIVATDDPLLLLSLQVRHFHSSLRPLPMVAWYQGPFGETRRAWDALHGRRVIFWSQQMSPKVLLQCQRTEGYLVLAGPEVFTEASVREYLRKRQPADFTRLLYKHARPWRETLKNWLRTASDSAVSALLSRMADIDRELLEYMRQHSPKIQRLAPQFQVRRMTVEEYRVVERNGRWFTEHGVKEKPLLNGTVRIETIIERRRGTEYCGTLLLEGGSATFRETCQHRRFQEMLRRVARRNGLHMEHHHDTRISLLSVALAFHQPEVVPGKTRIGWDGKRFMFKRFHIRGGRLRSHPENLFPVDCPGPQVAKFSLTDSVKARLGVQEAAVEPLWATAVSLATAVMASVACKDGPGTLLCGEGLLSHAVPLLERLGVSARSTRLLQRSTEDCTTFSTIRWPHRWPLCVKLAERATMGKLHKWLLSTPLHGVCFCTDAVSAYVVGAQGSYHVVQFEDVLPAKIVAAWPAEKVLPAYLRYASGQLFRLEPKATWWDTIHSDMLRWLESDGIDTHTAAHARRHVAPDGDPDTLSKLIATLYRRGRLSVDALVDPVAFDARGLLVTRERLARELAKSGFEISTLGGYTDPIVVPREFFQKTP